MSRGPNSHSPFVLGFREVQRRVPRDGKAQSDGYPPYNIERISLDGGRGGRLRIILAVAGFSRDQIEILHGSGQLVIRGRQTEEKDRLHIHRGIATRQFQRVFLLAEAMEVAVATLERGLLSVELAPAEAD